MTNDALPDGLDEIRGLTGQEIFDSIRMLIQTGRFPPGDTLPPVRELANRLGVNRNTVSGVYKRLAEADIVATNGRAGTVVCSSDAMVAREDAEFDSSLTDLASGNPNPLWLPNPLEALVGLKYQPRLYGEPLVDAVLEGHARSWLGTDCPGDFVLNLTHGAVDAIDRLLAAHLVAGDRVAVEQPSFLGNLKTRRSSGLRSVGVPVDQWGMRADRLEAALAAGAHAVIVTPRAHNPTGCGLSSQRARELSDVLGRYPHVLVIVDDHFSLLAETPYWNIVPHNAPRWALIRSVSKILGPDLRFAFVASDAATSRRLRFGLVSGTNWVSHLIQQVVTDTLFSPEAANRFASARGDYAKRRQQLAAALATQGIKAAYPSDGLNLWVPLKGMGAWATAALKRHGWLVRTGGVFSKSAPCHGLRVTVSMMDAAQAHRFANDLKHILAAPLYLALRRRA